jgi:hypothetical protein
MTHDTPPRIRCRPIGDADIAGLIELLTKGYPNRTRGYWARAMQQLARRETPAAYPRFGYMLELDGTPVGVMLLIFSALYAKGEVHVRCNGSSWYVDPKYRGYAPLLLAATVRYKDVTYTNLTPAAHTWPIIEAQGFTRYSFGQIMACPALNSWVANTCVRQFDTRHDYGPTLREEERYILVAHAGYGCLTYVVTEKGEANPFVFLPRRFLRGIVPAAQLVYCRDVRDFVRFAGPIGRALTRRGILFVCLDAVGPLPGLMGNYFFDRGPRYFTGPERPRLGDLAFSEMVLFGP